MLAGRGLDVQELNVGNLGVGDLWDLDSAIDHLDKLGWIDTTRVGSKGWSQGGYISAFAALHSDPFAAVSVGAGVSGRHTCAITSDIPDFTRDVLGVELFGEHRSVLRRAADAAASATQPWPIPSSSHEGVGPGTARVSASACGQLARIGS